MALEEARAHYEKIKATGDAVATEVAKRILAREGRALARKSEGRKRWCAYHLELHPVEEFYSGEAGQCLVYRALRRQGLRSPVVKLTEPLILPGRTCAECRTQFEPVHRESKCPNCSGRKRPRKKGQGTERKMRKVKAVPTEAKVPK